MSLDEVRGLVQGRRLLGTAGSSENACKSAHGGRVEVCAGGGGGAGGATSRRGPLAHLAHRGDEGAAERERFVSAAEAEERERFERAYQRVVRFGEQRCAQLQRLLVILCIQRVVDVLHLLAQPASVHCVGVDS